MDYSNAINDLRFLETRFKNLMEMIPHLTELGSLENAVDEAKRQIDSLKGDIESLGKNKVAAEDALKASQKVLDNRKADFDSWLEIETKKAKADASAIVKEATDTAKGLIADAKSKADDVAKAVKSDEDYLAELKAKIDLATDQYAEITTKLQSIKNSI